MRHTIDPEPYLPFVGKEYEWARYIECEPWIAGVFSHREGV